MGEAEQKGKEDASAESNRHLQAVSAQGAWVRGRVGCITGNMEPNGSWRLLGGSQTEGKEIFRRKNSTIKASEAAENR